MEFYQQSVLGLAFFLLIATYIIIMKTTLSKSNPWPISQTMCPDYWKYDNIKSECQYVNFNRGDPNSPEIIKPYEIGASRCDKYKWLMTNGYKNISWEGITYGVNLNDCQ